ncbi:hypothetical protein Tco_1286734, partial [Tanacetum coccineum]
LYKDVNVNLRKEDVEITDADQGGADQHNVAQVSGSSVSPDFTEKLLNFENVSPADNETASLMDTTVCHEEPSGHTSSLYTVPVTVIPEITYAFITTISPPPPSFNPLLQQATPTPTPIASEVPTLFPTLPNFASVFRFNDKVTNLERDLSEMKQVDQYAQAITSIPAIVDRYIDNKQREAIQQAIKAIIKEEVKTQLPQILPQAVLEFATLVIEQNITESLEADVLAKSLSQPKSTYKAVASFSEFELTKIRMDKMEEYKSYLRADYKRELYDALIKIKTPSAGSDRGTKRRKSSKDAESSRDPKSKEYKSTSSSKGASRSQHKSSGKTTHAEEPSHTVGDSGVQHNQEFDTGNNEEQPNDETASKVDWFKKPEQPPTPNPDWNKRQHVDFRPPQTWISNIAHA